MIQSRIWHLDLYITKFVVDVSNITATQIVLNGFNPDADGDVDISGTFMNSLGITSMIGLPENADSEAWSYEQLPEAEELKECYTI